MVFDGLETMFARSMVSALLCLLKAINNRRYIYFVNLFQDFAAMKAREISKQEQEGKNDVVFVGSSNRSFLCLIPSYILWNQAMEFVVVRFEFLLPFPSLSHLIFFL